MKKAKILVPAMGMMLLSTAAAVSGTMAWFSANRAVDVTTTDFAVEALDGSLTVLAYDLAGTDADGSDASIALDSGVKLADASFNHNTGVLYTDIANDAGTVTGFSVVGGEGADLADLTGSNDTLWADTYNNKIMYAVAFKLTFSYEFKGDSTDRHLFFNAIDSSSTHEKQDHTAYGSEKHNTYKGFRMAFIAGSEKIVWAPERGTADKYWQKTDTDAATGNVALTYVSGTAAANVTSYAIAKDADYSSVHTQELLCSQTTNNKPAALAADNPSNNTDHTNRFDYLGTIEKPGTANGQGKYIGTLDVKCVAWFEGTDPDVINEATMDQVSTAMSFYCRTAKASA